MHTRLKLLTGSLAVVSLAAGAMLLATEPARSEFDYPALSAQVQNHEARISNSEKDIKTLQDSTGTPPAPEHQAVPASTPPPQSAAPAVSQPAPATPVEPAAPPVPVGATAYCTNNQYPNPTAKYRIGWSDGHTTIESSPLGLSLAGSSNTGICLD